MNCSASQTARACSGKSPQSLRFLLHILVQCVCSRPLCCLSCPNWSLLLLRRPSRGAAAPDSTAAASPSQLDLLTTPCTPQPKPTLDDSGVSSPLPLSHSLTVTVTKPHVILCITLATLSLNLHPSTKHCPSVDSERERPIHESAFLDTLSSPVPHSRQTLAFHQHLHYPYLCSWLALRYFPLHTLLPSLLA